MIATTRSTTLRTILIALLLAAFGLRLWNLNQPSVWHDEAWSIRAVRDPINTPDDNTPLVYYSLGHFLYLGAGESPLALRYGSVLLGLLTVALAARLALRWGGWEVAVLAAALLAFSPLLWAYAREVRGYVLVPLWTLALLALADRLLAARERFPWRAWGLTLLVELLLLYTHNLSVPVVVWLNLAVGAGWVWERRWRWLAIWLGGQAAALVAYLPWVLSQSPSGTPLNSPPQASLSLIWDVWQGYFAPLPAMVGEENPLVIASAIFGLWALALLAGMLLWNRDRRRLLLASQAVLLPVLSTVLLMVANIDFHPRYYVAGVPAALLLIALQSRWLPPILQEHGLPPLSLPVTLALASAAAAVSFPALFDEPQYQHDNFQALARHYADLPADALIVIPYGWEPALEEYYVEKAGIEAQIVGVDLHSDLEAALDALNAALDGRKGAVHVELLTWYQLPADARGMYSCLLEAAGTLAGNTFTVQGLSTQAYAVTGPLAFTPLPEMTADYGTLRLETGAVTGDGSLCLQTDWRLAAQRGEDWRVSARLVTTDPPGWTVARSDSDIRRADQAPTSDWAVDDAGAAFSLLRIPPGTPPGDYDVQLVVFSREQISGLDRLVDGVPSGRVVTLATLALDGTTDTVPADLEAGQTVVPGLELVSHDAADGPLNPGQELRITLRWRVQGSQDWTGATLALRGADWALEQPVMALPAYSLDRHSFRVPPDASGSAQLILEPVSGEPIPLAVYSIEESDHLFTPPPYDVAVGAVFGSLAVLEGVNVPQTAVSSADVLELTLVWRVEGTASAAYKVFTHLLDDQGRVIAQDDAYPLSGARPTTGWLPGEYLVDTYHLAFLPEYADYRGPARLEVGFYNPETGVRVPVANGADYAILPIEITVQ